MFDSNSTFVYYGLRSPYIQSTRILNIRVLGFCLIYHMVKYGTRLDKILSKIIGEPEY